MTFSYGLLTGFGLGFHEGQHPGTMLHLVAGVQIGVIGLAGLEHLPKDFQEALSHTPQRARMTFAFGALLSVVNFGPRTNSQATLGPQMDGVAQNLIARAANMNPVNLAGLETDWSGAGDALQGLGVLKAIGVAADFAQQPRGQSLGGAGQRAKQVMVGMLFKERFDLLAV